WPVYSAENLRRFFAHEAARASTTKYALLLAMKASQNRSQPFHPTRRSFLQSAALAGFASLLGNGRLEAELADKSSHPEGLPPTDSDVGSLFPFIESQVVKGEFPLSFVN